MRIVFQKQSFNLSVLPRLLNTVQALKDGKDYELTINAISKKRSRNANNYYHALINEIAHINGTSMDEVHEIMLERYGTYLTDENGEILTMSLPNRIDPVEVEIHCKYIGESKLNEKTFYHYRIIKGSRFYNTKEMSYLINGAVSEAKEMGIETLTPDEIARLKYE